MRRANDVPTTEAPRASLFDACVASRILQADAGIEWPDGAEPRDIHIQRGWPMRSGSLVAEWSFDLGGGRRYALFAMPCADAAGADSDDSKNPVVNAQGIRGLRVHVPRWGVRIHSPDRDPDMPHLARCLDEREMAERLSNSHQALGNRHWASGVLRGVATPVAHRPVPGARCLLLSYRAGRRAAIGYRSFASDGISERLMGKTYCDGRGERLVPLHAELDRRLALSTNGRVRVPAAVGYLADLQMTLFAWIHGEKAGPSAPQPGDLRNHAALAADALAALHLETVEDLPEFTVADECAVINRWHAALDSVDVRFSDATRSLPDALHSCAESAELDQRCTLHRDFYEGQFVYDGRTITLLDLDTLAAGDPCLDLGNVLAHMFLQHLRASVPVHDFVSAAKLLLRTYTDRITNHGGASGSRAEKRAPLNPQRLTFYWASALFRVGAVHALRTSTGRHAASLWQFAEKLLTAWAGGQRARGLAVGDRAVIPDPQCIMGELSS